MSDEKQDADPASAPPPLLSKLTVSGIVCFGAGLLLLGIGVVMALRFFLDADAVALLVGILLALVGVGVNITGLILLYRGAISPQRGESDGSGNP